MNLTKNKVIAAIMAIFCLSSIMTTNILLIIVFGFLAGYFYTKDKEEKNNDYGRTIEGTLKSKRE